MSFISNIVQQHFSMRKYYLAWKETGATWRAFNKLHLTNASIGKLNDDREDLDMMHISNGCGKNRKKTKQKSIEFPNSSFIVPILHQIKSTLIFLIINVMNHKLIHWNSVTSGTIVYQSWYEIYNYNAETPTCDLTYFLILWSESPLNKSYMSWC